MCNCDFSSLVFMQLGFSCLENLFFIILSIVNVPLISCKNYKIIVDAIEYDMNISHNRGNLPANVMPCTFDDHSTCKCRAKINESLRVFVDKQFTVQTKFRKQETKLRPKISLQKSLLFQQKRLSIKLSSSSNKSFS